MKKKNILIYYSANKRSVVIETIAAEINKSGHHVIVLTTGVPGELHSYLDSQKIENKAIEYPKTNPLFFYIKHFLFLISFCKKNEINTVWSHLQGCNLVAVFAQFFISAKVVIFRHHFHASIKEDGMSSVNRNERLFEKIICKLAKQIIVPSLEVYNGMVQYEKVPQKKITIVPYIYNFEKYNKPDALIVNSLKEKYAASLRILIASRMIKMKRHMLVMPVFNKLIKQGYDIKVLLLDEGEEKETIQNYVRQNGLDDKVFFIGYQLNIVDFINLADLVVHPSFTEASSSLIKEAGLAAKPVIVCSGVGDFDEYIVHLNNGFLVNTPDEASQFENYIKLCYENPALRKETGDNLRITVLDKFTVSPTSLKPYLELL